MNSRDVAFSCLTGAQRAAWRHVREEVRSRHAEARARVADILRSSGCAQSLFDAATASVRRYARVVLHFHPDRIGVKAITVAEALLDEGQYHGPGSSIADRPKYGALELIRYPDGPWPRFGSCYFVLRADVARRTSFTYSGSEQPDASERLGTIDSMEGVFAPLLAEVARGEGAKVPWPPFVAPILGVESLTVPGLLERLARALAWPRADPSSGSAGRVLDSGIEAQVHGPIELARDVERLVVDPAFAGTTTGDRLEEVSRNYAIPLDWHVGFRLAAQDVPDDFRGPAIPRLARRIAGGGVVDAAVIGSAEASLRLRPDEWRDVESREEIRRQLKQLWHVLVHYGEPAGPSGAAA